MRFILQRRLQTGDRNLWRSVVRFLPGDSGAIEAAVGLLSAVDIVQWRIVEDTRAQSLFAAWDGRKFVAVP